MFLMSQKQIIQYFKKHFKSFKNYMLILPPKKYGTFL